MTPGRDAEEVAPTASGRGAVIALTAAVALPLLVAMVALHGQHWFPTGDLAQAEMKVRDVFAHPPLLGAAGRIRDNGSHPGPAMWYLLAPIYRLFGSTPWALQVSVILVNIAWLAAGVAVAWRRGRAGLCLGFLAVSAVLLRSFGAAVLTEPWNPSVALVPWLCFFLLAWSVLDDDLWLLPFAVAVGSYCIQDHVGYAPLVGGLLALAIAVRLIRPLGDGRRAVLLRSVAVAAGVGVLLWVPPAIEQLTAHGHPGNVTLLYRNFSKPDDTPIGLSGGFKLLMVMISPIGGWFRASQATSGSILPGLALVLAWAAAAFVAWRRGLAASLVRLHAVIGVALAISVISMARIFGPLFSYIVKWAWAFPAFMLLAIGWTVVEALGTGWSAQRWRQAGALVGAAAIVASTVFAVQAASVDAPGPPFSRVVRGLMPATESAIDRHTTYLVTWDDPEALGAVGFGTLLELERHGFHVKAAGGATDATGFRAAVTPHRLAHKGTYQKVLHVVTGPDLAEWDARADARRIAYLDPRTPAQQAEVRRLHASVADDLRRAGLAGLVPQIDRALFMVGLNPSVPTATKAKVGQMITLGLPTGIYLTDPGPFDGV